MKKQILSLLGGLLVIGGAGQLFTPLADAREPLLTFPESSRVVPTSNTQVQLSYSPVVKQTAPAVVNVFTSRTVRTRSRSSFFDEMFGFGRAPQELSLIHI